MVLTVGGWNKKEKMKSGVATRQITELRKKAAFISCSDQEIQLYEE